MVSYNDDSNNNNEKNRMENGNMEQQRRPNRGHQGKKSVWSKMMNPFSRHRDEHDPTEGSQRGSNGGTAFLARKNSTASTADCLSSRSSGTMASSLASHSPRSSAGPCWDENIIHSDDDDAPWTPSLSLLLKTGQLDMIESKSGEDDNLERCGHFHKNTGENGDGGISVQEFVDMNVK